MQALFAILVVFMVAIRASATTTASRVVATGKPGAMTASQVLDEFAKTQKRLLSCTHIGVRLVGADDIYRESSRTTYG